MSIDVPVLVVGGGPVGLTARALLSRWGVETLLVEKRTELSPFPRSRLVNVRSMEIFRQLGLASRIRAAAFRPEFGRVRFRDTLFTPDYATAAMVGVNAPIPESPEIGVCTSQDRLEPVLLGAADAETRFGVELVDLAEEPECVLATLADRRGGEQVQVRARYVLGTDGANSTVRRLVGIDTAGPGALANVTTVVFDAQLDRWLADYPAGVYFTTIGSFLPLYPEGGWAWFAPTPPDPEHTDWRGLVVRALGSDTPVEVLRVQHWTMTAFLAERFGRGRVLLAGDSAHPMPIIGGMGMNTGLADVHNLCWKLAGALGGWAGPELLDSYQTERRPVAGQTLRQAVANTQLLLEVQKRRLEQAGDGSPGEVELPWSERYFAQLGLVLGVSYDPAGWEPAVEYTPTTRPGQRMPHLRLPDGRSSLDALGEWFTLFTPQPDRWRREPPPPWPLHLEPLPAAEADLLVRPDGHIATLEDLTSRTPWGARA